MACLVVAVAPHHSLDPTHPHQMNGHCALLDVGDWEPDSGTDLWDQVKSCDINMDDEGNQDELAA